jgi:hypothetical protein
MNHTITSQKLATDGWQEFHGFSGFTWVEFENFVHRSWYYWTFIAGCASALATVRA